MSHHNYLSRFRKQFALAQHELAELLDTSESTVSRIEDGTTPPNLAFALGCAVLFKMPPADFFPGIAAAVKQATLGHLAAFSLKVEHEHGPAAERRREFLREIADREDYEFAASTI